MYPKSPVPVTAVGCRTSPVPSLHVDHDRGACDVQVNRFLSVLALATINLRKNEQQDGVR